MRQITLHQIAKLNDLSAGLPSFGDYMLAGLKALIVIAIVSLGWWVANRLTTEFDDHDEIVEQQNMPFALARIGLLLGQVVAIVPLASAHSADTRSDLLWLTCGGLSVIVLFNCVIRPITGRLLSKLHGANSMRDMSLAAAIAQTAFYVADGLVMHGALSGSAPSTVTGVEATLVFTTFGLIVLGIAYWCVGKCYKLHATVANNNVESALILGSITVGLGAILRSAIAGDFKGWTDGLVGFIAAAVIGTLVLTGLLPILDKLILSKATIRLVIIRNRHAAAATVGMFILGVAIGLSAIVV